MISAVMAIGLFDIQGGASVHPTHQITSPMFDRVTIHLNQQYFSGKVFVVTTRNNSVANIYIQSAKLNGQPLNQFWFPHMNLISGGLLGLELDPQPSR